MSGPGWDLSCPDWEDRLATGRSLVPTLPKLDLVAGERAVQVFNRLRLADVPGTPTMAEAGGDWFRDIVRALFGSVDPVTKHRMIRELFLLVPKKNSKTTNGALLMLVALLLNRRPNASLILTAPVQDVAQLAYDAARGAIELDPVLSQKLHVRDHLKKIIHRETKAELDIMSFDPAALTGQKPVAVLIDEVHVISKMSKAASAVRQLRGGMLPFPEAFLAMITTQSEEAPAGVFRAELQKARAIRDGKETGAMLPILYEFPPAMQKDRFAWRDPVNWPMVTPNAGRSVTIERLVEDMRTAENTSEEEFRAWASQHLNVEIGLQLHSDRWVGADFWEEAGGGPATLDALLERSEVVTIGIDGGGLDDLLGLAVIGRDSITRQWLLWGRAWAHPSVLERRKAEAPRFLDFERDGDLVIVPTIGPDVEQVAEIVKRVQDSGKLNLVGLDPVGVGDIREAIERQSKAAAAKCVSISQGWKLTSAIKSAERALAEGRLIHAGQPLLAWAVSNAKVIPAGNAVLITKQASGSGKIDPLMAALDAVDLMSRNPPAAVREYRMLFA